MAFILSVLCLSATGQNVKHRRPAKVPSDTSTRSIPNPDYAAPTDTILLTPKVISPNAITSLVEYSAKDSVVNDLQRRYIYLFGGAMVRYEDMELRADYIEIDFKNNELYASGVADSNGVLHGNPVFIQGEGNYYAREIKYNFTTKKGKITHVITTQDDGYSHGE